MTISEAMNKIVDGLADVSFTENGARGYSTTHHPLLDMNFKTSSYRNLSETEIIRDFRVAWKDEPLAALKWLFFARDIRGGMGERRLFRVLFKEVAKENPALAARLMPLVPEYGRWDDLWELIVLEGTEAGNVVLPALVDFVSHTIRSDLIAYQLMVMNKGKPSMSLLGKWLPSLDASSPPTKARAKWMSSHLWRQYGNKVYLMQPREYTQILRTLRKALKIVERDMSANRWDEIDYSAVPSQANLRYKNAFLRHDTERRTEFLESLKKGTDGAKINANTVFPYEIVHQAKRGKLYKCVWNGWRAWYFYTEDLTCEAMWKALPRRFEDDGGTIVVSDGSGSMQSPVGKHSVTAMDVAQSLAIYFAEGCKGAFHNRFITFSHTPQLVHLGDDNTSLAYKLTEISKHMECENTNIEAVFNLLLTIALEQHISPDEMPKRILIISDMEFDYAATAGRSPSMSVLFGTIRLTYEAHGYQLPKLVLWNVMSRTNTIPVRENKLGVALVSGFSPQIAKMVMSDKTDPYEILMEQINSERYAPVERAVNGTAE